jgi:glycosyltransferase involved in cell wall biosynthesis
MNKAISKIDVTMIGTLPPTKGISPYCAELVNLLGEHLRIEFLDFKRLYPEMLYPGRTEDEDLYPLDMTKCNISRRRILDFCNPLSWIKAGFSARGHIVHAQWWTGVLSPVYLVALGIARLRGKRVIVTVHNVDPHEDGIILRFLNKSILPLGNEFIVHGDASREKLLGRVHADKKVHVVPHPPFNSVHDGPNQDIDIEAVRAEFGIDGARPLLIFFGNIRDYKGLDILLRALPGVREAHPDVRLLVAGQLWGDWNKYERIIEEQGIEGQLITRLEHLPFRDLRKYIIASDLAVFPFTHLDSASGTVVLARSLGKPIVVSEVGDMGDLKEQGIMLAKPGCPDSLAETINNALRHVDESRGSRFSSQAAPEENGHEIVRAHMSIYRGSPLSPIKGSKGP